MTYEPQGTVETDFLAREYKVPGGWRLPLHGNLMSYVYVGLLDVAFEVWLGGDWDVTVRLERPFTFGLGASPTAFDPRTTRKSELAPLLEIGTLEVDEFLVKEIGELDITFTDRRRLVAGPADEERAWCLEWPTAGEVACRHAPAEGSRGPERYTQLTRLSRTNRRGRRHLRRRPDEAGSWSCPSMGSSRE